MPLITFDRNKGELRLWEYLGMVWVTSFVWHLTARLVARLWP